MGFLKKRSATKFSGGDGKIMSPARSTASVASRAEESRGDVSSNARGSDCSRCDSDSFASQAKGAPMPPRSHHRNDSLSSAMKESTPTKVQKAQQRPAPTTTKTSRPPKLAVPSQSGRSATANVAKGRHEAKGRFNHKSPEPKKLAPSRKKYPMIKKRWMRKEAMSESSIGSSDDSDDDSEDDSDEGTDGDSENDGETTSDGETTYTKASGSYESDGDDSTNADNYATSFESKTTEDIDDFTEDQSHRSSKNMSSPFGTKKKSVSLSNIVDMMEKVGGIGERKKMKEEGKEVVATAAASPVTLKSPPKDPDHTNFLKEMDSFTLKNPEHQLILQITEHGSVDKLLLRVSLSLTDIKCV
jgi:hypothetical protein